MPGTVVRDALETNLLAANTLDSAASSNGTALEIGWTGFTQFVVETGTIDSGTGDEVLSIEIQGCESSDFSTTDVVSYGTMNLVDTDDDSVFGMVAFVNQKYVRAVTVAGGTTPDFSGTTCKAVQPHYLEVRSAHPTAQALA